MDISAATTSDLKPDAAIGNLLQLIKAAGLDKSGSKEEDAAGVEGNPETGNMFLQVLQQKLAVLLQSNPTDPASELSAKEELSCAIEKLLEGDHAAAGEILSGFPFLAQAGKMEDFVPEVEERAKESLSAIIDQKGTADILKEKLTGKMGQFSTAAFQDKEEAGTTETMELAADGNGTKHGIVAALHSGDRSLQGGLPGSMASGKDVLEIPLDVYTDGEGQVSAVAEDSAPDLKYAQERTSEQTNGVSLKMAGEASITQMPIPENRDKNLTGYSDVLKKAALEGKDNAFPSPITSGMNSTENAATGENENFKISEGLAGTVQENKTRSNISRESRDAEESLTAKSLPDQTGQYMKKKSSIQQDVDLAGKQPSEFLNDSSKNIPGKVTAPATETAGLMEKVKTESRSKTVASEKTLESNTLNSASMAGVNTGKTPDAAPAEIINRVAAEFNEKLMSEGGRVKITLAPPSLGTLEMDVTVHNSRVRVMLTAENQDVQKILAGNLDTLKGSLQGQGLTIERCDVMMQDRREQYSQGFNNQQTFNQEQSAKEHQDSGESYNPSAQALTSPIIIPKQQQSWRSGTISIFA